MAIISETKKVMKRAATKQAMGALCSGPVRADFGKKSAPIEGLKFDLIGPGEQPRTQVAKRLSKWIIRFGKTGTEKVFSVHAAVVGGIGISVADALKSDLNINDKQMAEALGTSESTLLRWRKAGKDLDEVASDRLVRYIKILEIATEVFGDTQKAQSWLKRPQFGLAGEIPLELMKSEVGAREVESLLMRIEHGVLA
jgi:putative toxin-antitoxin system antitoxin component (TIGR02293 family)